MHHFGNFLNNCCGNNISRRINNIHFVGIGGSGMSGIAEVLHNLGFKVTGSDLVKNEATQRLTNIGLEITYFHIAENVAYCDAIVVSSAVAADNIELVIANHRRIPIIHRAEMLAELMRFKYGIAVAGSHGKTTTTSLIATILAEAGQDPTFVVGGKLNKFSANAKLGAGEFFVAESDESDESFLQLSPLIAIVTNIDNDHLSNYGNNFDNLKQAFLRFLHKLPFYGLAVVCRDDPSVLSIMKHISRPLLSYGFSEQADLRIINYSQQKNVSKFQILLPNEKFPQDVILNLPGKHNALNALAAIAVAMELKIDFSIIAQVLKTFHGIGRRFQIHGEFLLNNNKFLLIDDYGHHPQEIKSVILSIREGWVDRRLVIVFQPHRYTRTKQLFNDFVEILACADQIILLEVYSAGELLIEDVSSEKLSQVLCKKHGNKPVLIPQQSLSSLPLEELLLAKLSQVLQPNDILLMQGAGDVGKLTTKLITKLQANEEIKV